MRTLASALPTLLLIFAIFANFTVSMLLETDAFVWSAIVASQVAISATRQQHPGGNRDT
jgi:hypothetical protein